MPLKHPGDKVRDSPKEGVCTTGPPEVHTEFCFEFKALWESPARARAAALQQAALLARAAAPTAPCSSGLQNLLFKLEPLSLSPPTSCPALLPSQGWFLPLLWGPDRLKRRSPCSHKTKGFLRAWPRLGRAGRGPLPESLS